jgi:hypothetical protein
MIYATVHCCSGDTLDWFVEKMIRHVMVANHRRRKVMSFFIQNKPERVFGLQVRCKELDIFKIFFGIFLDFFLEFFGIFFWEFWGIF